MGAIDGHIQAQGIPRWQAGERLPDDVLCRAVWEMEAGLIDAELGGMLVKKRIASPGRGKRGGYRVLLSARIGHRYVFLHGFPKCDIANVTWEEQRALRFAGRVLLEMSADRLAKAIRARVLMEVRCGKQNH